MVTKPNKRKKALKVIKLSPYALALLVGCLLSFHLTEYYTTPHKILRGDTPPIKLFFSPNGGCAVHIIDTIHQAQKEIYIAMFVLSHKGIADALVSAKKRGIDIHIIANKKQANARYSQLANLHQHKIDIYLDDRQGGFHHK